MSLVSIAPFKLKEQLEMGRTQGEYKAVVVTADIDSDSNRILTLSAGRAQRPKRQEASIRLKDHLKLFPDPIAFPSEHQREKKS